MELDAWQLKTIIREAAKEAVQEYIRCSNPTSDEITYSKACRRYGEGWLDHQIAIGAAKWIRKGVYQNSPENIFYKTVGRFEVWPFKTVEGCNRMKAHSERSGRFSGKKKEDNY